MTRFQAWLLHGSVIALTLTGVVFAWMRYAMTTDDPFAVANHPWQPHMLHLHVLAAPVAVFALGLVYSGHILPKQQFRVMARRRTGLGALWMIVPMVLSGYLMQVVTGETALQVAKVTHWVSSGLFVLAYAAHQVLRPTGVVSLEAKTDDDAIPVVVRGESRQSIAAARDRS